MDGRRKVLAIRCYVQMPQPVLKGTETLEPINIDKCLKKE
jgi:hypothetical protein